MITFRVVEEEKGVALRYAGWMLGLVVAFYLDTFSGFCRGQLPCLMESCVLLVLLYKPQNHGGLGALMLWALLEGVVARSVWRVSWGFFMWSLLGFLAVPLATKYMPRRLDFLGPFWAVLLGTVWQLLPFWYRGSPGAYGGKNMMLVMALAGLVAWSRRHGRKISSLGPQ